jgi:hypothetical protein
MSGILRMNEWEDSLAAGREHVERQAPEEVKLARLLNQEMNGELMPVKCEPVEKKACSHPKACHFIHNEETYCSACGDIVEQFVEQNSKRKTRPVGFITYTPIQYND